MFVSESLFDSNLSKLVAQKWERVSKWSSKNLNLGEFYKFMRQNWGLTIKLISNGANPTTMGEDIWMNIKNEVNRGQNTLCVRTYGVVGQRYFFVSNGLVIRDILMHDKNRAFVQKAKVYSGFAKSIQNCGEHPDYYEGPKKALLPFCVDALKQRSHIVIQMLAKTLKNDWSQCESIDLHQKLLTLLLHGQVKAFFDYDIQEFDPKGRTDASFTQCLDVMINKYVLETPTEGQVEWFHEQVRGMLAASPPGTFGHKLKELARTEGVDFTHEHAFENAQLFVVAVTPVYGIFWSIVSILRDSRVVEKLCDLASQASSSKAAEEAYQKYVLMCVKEALRLFPPVPVLIERVAVKSTTLSDGTYIPEGSIVAVSHSWANVDQEYRPERWEANTRITQKSFDDPNAPYFPFGAGKHECMGRWFATKLIPEFIETLFSSDYKLAIKEDSMSQDIGESQQQRTRHLSAYFCPRDRVSITVESL
mmetsp:Transcript_33028/g.52981  ORF Transcript_33028/g.52981 Transcript_33028/m.52981 type:complete len:477 (+) Transcript_33028:278-1708(+)|eukprot:CAMPEP_0203765656 /NCGR_PEP_ID=MMETSP0098-20131031/18531_1 /ASSEMBLY_ACC=CAM_ASM_000208 /TAXON_ID=96639 /ORGANISM=" , Strain NY0313808BC1" /LENGTH=476 /DNA_ID=CAMNT_0050661929 /DNA_START=2483 /DNA_END=3913 /DNA_ORIENTATION=-